MNSRQPCGKWAAWAAGLMAAVCIEAQGAEEATVGRIEYLGWKDAWRLRNWACELVVVEQISRVMHFSARGGKNVMWVNQKFAGKVFDKDDGQWHNFGGEKVWPTQQSLWAKYIGRDGWPPPYEFDSGIGTAEQIKGGVRLRTARSRQFGACVVREFALDATRPLVHVRQFLEKSEGDAVEMCLWTVAQVREPTLALMALGPGKGEERYKPLGKLVGPHFSVHETVLSLRNCAAAQKVGVAGNEGWVAAVYENEKMMVVQSHEIAKDGKYPDGGCNAELYSSDKPAMDYVELELLSPLREIKRDETLRDDAVWQIVPVTEEECADPEKAGAAARRAHETALEILKKQGSGG